jgi:hypothetical protein
MTHQFVEPLVHVQGGVSLVVVSNQEDIGDLCRLKGNDYP